MKLVIVESPHKSITISRYLGEGYKVLASQGHIRDLSSHGKGGLGIDCEHNFKPDWVISEDKKDIVSKLRKEAKKADEVLLATDPDREGEAISWHLSEVLGLDLNTTKRLSFHEVTKPAILEAIENPKRIDMHLVESQMARRMYDRIIGFKLSSLMQKKVGAQSAGRVQSATLKMIVDNHKERLAFKPEEYWTISVILDVNGQKLEATLAKIDGKAPKIKNKEEAEAILARIPANLPLSSLTKAKKKIEAKYPFTTSTMQQEAYNRFKFSTDRTQRIAQHLYEGVEVAGENVGLITYMRTDSARISPEFYNRHAKPFILETWGPDYLGNVKPVKNSANAQDAHEAIRPTGTHRTPEMVAPYLTAEQNKLYRLIYARAMASMMSAKIVEETKAVFSANGLDFTLSGQRTLFKGYEVVYGQFEDDESKSLPEMIEGNEYKVVEPKEEQKFTQPPAAYTEARVVKLMEEKGIGRPSTYASTIKTLINHKYITSKGGVTTPTEEGIHITEVLGEYFPEIVSTEYTADMENELDKIERGDDTWLNAMNEFYDPFMEKLGEVAEKMKKDPAEKVGRLCPKCGGELVYKKSKFGTFIACSNFPKCKYIEPEKPKETGELCPECGHPLVEKKSKRGTTFIGCSNFPHCNYIKPDEKKKAAVVRKKTTITEADWVKPCPKCGKGHLIVRHSAKGDFLGCTNFPRCRYTEDPSKGEKK